MSLLTAVNGLSLCLVICAASLLAAGAAGPVHVAILLGVAAWQKWRWSGGGGAPDARRWWWEAASLAALAFFIADLFVVTRDLVGAALRLLVFIVAYHADNPQPARRARQTLGLTLIQMIAASASTTEVAFSALMSAYLVAALWTLAAIGAAESDPETRAREATGPDLRLRGPLFRVTAASAPAVLAAGLVVFFVIPHYGTGYFRERGRSLRRNLTGFSEKIELGSIGSIKKSHATVMRIQRWLGGEPPPLPLRLRGVALDRFNGRAWEMTDVTRRAVRASRRGEYVVSRDRLAAITGQDGSTMRDMAELRARRDVLALQILLEPLESQVLFTPPDVITLTTMQYNAVFAGRQDDLYAAGPRPRRIPYRTTSIAPGHARAARPDRMPGDAATELDPVVEHDGRMAPGAAGLPERDLERYLQLPALDPRIPALARQAVRGAATPEERARALEDYLLRGFGYSLDVNDSAVADPLVHLLVDRRPGHCEYFATALAVLLRLEGIPSRVVTGFNGGEYSDLTGQAIVRQSDAHSWVEAWVPSTGWITLDPTPPDPTGGDPGLFASLWRFFDEAEIAWDTYIVGLDLQDQQSALEEVRDGFDLAVSGVVIRMRATIAALRELAGIAEGRLPASDGALALLLLLALFAGAPAGGFIVWRAARRSRAGIHPATALFRRFERRAAANGESREAWMSPAEFARLRGEPDLAAAFESARYGPAATSRDALERLHSLLAAGARIKGFAERNPARRRALRGYRRGGPRSRGPG